MMKKVKERVKRSMEEIDLRDLLKYFLKKVPIILVVSIVMLTIGVVYTLFFKTPLYRSNTTIILVSESKAESTLTQNDITLNQKLVNTYSEIIKSRRVLNKVIDDLALSDTVSSLSQKVNVSSIDNTEIIKISVSDPNSKDAMRIANAVADVFKEEVLEIYKLENVSIIDEAEQATEPYNIQLAKSGVLFFGVGMALSMMVIFVIYYFDTSVKSSEEIEERLGVPVIGTIPLAGKKGK